MSGAVGLDALPRVGPAALTLGVFDGVHRGHRHLLGATVAAARVRGLPSVALTFDPHPEEVVQPGSDTPRLAPLAETLARMAASGIDHAVAVRFDDSVRALTPEAFLDRLAPGIEARALLMTSESAFGRDRRGTIDYMRSIGPRRNLEVIGVDALIDGGAPISSSRIRAAIGSGAIREATRLLGAPPVFVGTVVAGDRRGRSLGYPTANLSFGYRPALPKLGIYLGRASVPERSVGPGHPSLVSVGVRPTFHEHGAVLVEVHLLDWDGDLYDTRLRLELFEPLRDERRFDTVDELVSQMRADEAMARRRFGSE